MKHLLHKPWLALITAVCVSFLMISNRPVSAEGGPVEITITAEDLRSVTNYMDATNEVKGILVTTTGMATFGCGGSPATEPTPQLTVIHTSESKGVNTLKFKTMLGDFTKIEISAPGILVGVDSAYQVPAGWSYGDDWAVWEGNTSELLLDAADLYPGIIADPIDSITFTIQPRVEGSVTAASGGIAPLLSAGILVLIVSAAVIYVSRRKKSQSSEKQ